MGGGCSFFLLVLSPFTTMQSMVFVLCCLRVVLQIVRPAVSEMLINVSLLQGTSNSLLFTDIAVGTQRVNVSFLDNSIVQRGVSKAKYRNSLADEIRRILLDRMRLSRHWFDSSAITCLKLPHTISSSSIVKFHAQGT